MSLIASRANSVSTAGSTSRIRRRAASTTRPPSDDTSRYSVWVSGPSGSTSVYWNVVAVTRAPLRAGGNWELTLPSAGQGPNVSPRTDLGPGKPSAYPDVGARGPESQGTWNRASRD